MKHNGINATRERLKDQLVIAADEKIRAASELAFVTGMWLRSKDRLEREYAMTLRARLARWWARVRG